VIEEHLTLLIERSMVDAKDVSEDALRLSANKLLEEFIKSVSFIDYLQDSLINFIARKVDQLKNWSHREHNWLQRLENKAASYIH